MKRLVFCLLLLVACGPSLGSVCEKSEDCAEVPNGYCSLTGICVAECSIAGEACESNALCHEAFTRTICLPICTSNVECRAAETCEPNPGGRVCVITDPLGVGEPAP